MKTAPPPKSPPMAPPGRISWVPKNPFEEFETVRVSKKEIPLDQIVQSTEETMDRIRRGY